MAQDDNGGKDSVSSGQHVSHDALGASPGTAVIVRDAVQDPGLPPHRPRTTDINPKAEKRAERVVYTLFYLSLAGSIFAIAAYIAFPIIEGDSGSVRLNNMFVGLGMTLALLGLGVGAVHWGKALMHDHEGIDIRHPQPGTTEERAAAINVIDEANRESGFGRRTMIRNSLLGALIVFPLPAVVLFRGLAPMDQDPVALLKHTMWEKGTRLTHDPSGVPIKASDLTLGSSVQVIPEGLAELEHHKIEEKAKAAVLLMRLDPKDLNPLPGRETWAYDGIVAYSKVCTHVGCPVALYEQQKHHLLCPCHQSQFDVTNNCEVIFGPAKRALPQLPITVDSEGYLIAQSDFTEPVGPSFWERA
ncbi:ubiquinol-cytochrome c reductase iron-sulfur subunit [Homoserinimonas sp. OAct 916]|uniref:cytochrome bc1 complex Rieske iron-sulfur subunit n=1 Tax=Homoserinimonas sp. OAct 916 TaxID=2211450 RepID=UPI000DBE6049|nr:Rieske 2Fe-2S domain-containing protein [Homoserinimonas sp. OAct 916]